MQLLLVVPDGVGIRNFIHGRFLAVAAAAGLDVEIASGVPAPALCGVAPALTRGRGLYEMPIYIENPAARFWRKTSEIAHLHHYHTSAMQWTLARNRPRGYARAALFQRVVAATGRLTHPLPLLHLLDRFHDLAVRRHPLSAAYAALLRAHRPAAVFFTHQRPAQILPLVAAAKTLNIPTVAFIFSWDNLSSKGRMPASFDHYLVWSAQMRAELLHFYPEIPPERVRVVGTPQFEPYAYTEFGWSEARFCQELGLPLGRRRICFSGGDPGTSPDDPLYVQTLAAANRAKAFGEEVDLIVRPSPADPTARFAPVLAAFPEICWSPPRWEQARPAHPAPWSQKVPQAADIDLLKALVQYCAVGVNMASTMTLDFACADKPVVNVSFGRPGLYRAGFTDADYYGYDHYRRVLEVGGVQWARTPDALIAAIRSYLHDPGQDRTGRQALVHGQLGDPLQGTSERLVAALQEIGATAGVINPGPQAAAIADHAPATRPGLPAAAPAAQQPPH
ncbi:MAG TPA: hypothetical protein VKY74_07575 [Chloroflexia bacterium]|nr:hypothetical protein [Chloroflexia bacterium]